MQLQFTKMHGLGNDFVVIDATRAPFEPNAVLLARLTDRRFGVGCDQVLVVDSPPTPDVDFGYRIFNADGSEVGQCGNGARCLARFVAERGLSRQHSLRVKTSTSVLELHQLADGRVRVDMGAPRFEPSELPFIVGKRERRYSMTLDDGTPIEFGAVSVGNPHVVIEVDNIDTAPVAVIGEALQHHPAFPERVNVGFVQFLDLSHARIRVHERGAGETLACGSGACAAMAVGRLWNRLAPNTQIILTGGTLVLEWAGGEAPMYMTGAAETVYQGTIEWQK